MEFSVALFVCCSIHISAVKRAISVDNVFPRCSSEAPSLEARIIQVLKVWTNGTEISGNSSKTEKRDTSNVERYYLFFKNIPSGWTNLFEFSPELLKIPFKWYLFMVRALVKGPSSCKQYSSSVHLIKTEMYQSRMLMHFCHVITVFQSLL